MPARPNSEMPGFWDEFRDCEDFFIGDDVGDNLDFDDPWDDPIDLDGNPVSTPQLQLGADFGFAAADDQVLASVSQAYDVCDGGAQSSGDVQHFCIAGVAPAYQTDPVVTLSQRLLDNWRRRRECRNLGVLSSSKALKKGATSSSLTRSMVVSLEKFFLE